MYFHQAMAQPDAKEFKKVAIQEFTDHCNKDHWDLITINQVPEGHQILDAVWSMKRKRDIKTRKVIKHKARLNVHGGQQELGETYYETYAAVVNWFTVRLIMLLSILNKWKTRQIDFVLAFLQAEIMYNFQKEL